MAGIIAKDTVHFVGGLRSQVGHADAGGGCTRFAWLLSLDLNDFMDVDGLPIIAGCDATEQSGGDHDGKVKLTHTDGGNFYAGAALITVGTIAFIDFNGTYADGRYEVLECGDNYIIIDLTHTGDQAGNDAWVGGAFNTIQNAIDKTDEADNANRYIFDNKNETPGAAITVNISGTQADDYHVYMIGFKDQPSDMDGPDGAYYGGANDMYSIENGFTGIRQNANSQWVELTGHGFVCNESENVHWRNINIIDVGLAEGGWVSSAGNSYSLSWHNCGVIKGNTASFSWSGRLQQCLIDDCYVGGVDMGPMTLAGTGINVTNSILNQANQGGINFSAAFAGSGTVYNCLFDIASTKIGVICADDGLFVIHNNTFVNGDVSAITIANIEANVAAWNNIFDMAAVDDLAIDITSGSLAECDYNCTYSTAAGAELTNPYYDSTKTADIPQVGENNIEVDPGFLGAAIGDFRTSDNLLRLGKPGPDGNRTPMGYTRPEFGKTLDRTRRRYQKYTHGYKI